MSNKAHQPDTSATPPVPPSHPTVLCAQMQAALIEIIEIISTTHMWAWHLVIDCFA